MSRDALLALLLSLVQAGALTTDDARALVAAFDDGRLTEADLPAAPLDWAGDGPAPALSALLAAAYAVALRRIARAYLRRADGTSAPVPASRALDVVRAVDRLPLAARTRLVDAVRANDLRGALAREAEQRTTVLFAGRDVATFGPGAPGSARRSAGEVGRWQRAMRAAYAEDAATMARLGAGGDLSAAQAARLARVVREKAAYVDAFAARLTQAAAGEAPALSVAQVRAALVRQSGEARGLFFTNAVEAEVGDDASRFEIWYHALDDPATCVACLEAEAGSPYPADGPYPVPSMVCLGGGACRCEITVEPRR